jgi:hypothetical protein
MKRTWLPVTAVVAILALICLFSENRAVEAAKPIKAAKTNCATCHADFSSVLPKGHAAVKGKDLSACTSCHVPDLAGSAKKNGFASRMHIAHTPPKGSLDCAACHTWSPGKSFGLVGQKGSWGAPKNDDMTLLKQILGSWAGSSYTDNLHARAGMSCAQCHGKGLPKADDTVENNRCLTCHGPLDQLAKKTEPKDFKDRNPHKSHLGDVACTVCHKAHAESKVYCLECHKKFEMKIKGSATAKP